MLSSFAEKQNCRLNRNLKEVFKCVLANQEIPTWLITALQQIGRVDSGQILNDNRYIKKLIKRRAYIIHARIYAGSRTPRIFHIQCLWKIRLRLNPPDCATCVCVFHFMRSQIRVVSCAAAAPLGAR
jgi:hypothetical protein